MPNAFQNRLMTEPEGDVLFGTNGIRRNPDALKNGMGLSQFIPDAPTTNPEDALFESMQANGTEEAIIPGPEAELGQARGEGKPDPTTILKQMGVPDDMMTQILEKLEVAKSNPAFGPGYKAGLQAGQQLLRRSAPGLSSFQGR